MEIRFDEDTLDDIKSVIESLHPTEIKVKISYTSCFIRTTLCNFLEGIEDDSDNLVESGRLRGTLYNGVLSLWYVSEGYEPYDEE